MSEASLAELRRWVPPVAWEALKRRVGTRFSGNYPSWAAATARSSGYDAPAIAERVAEATRRVLRGEAAFERDALVFQHMDYAWPLLACLLYVAARNEGQLSVVDFGGSLGSSYRQNARFFAGLKRVVWSVLEQQTFVELGQREFTTAELSFHSDLGRLLEEQQPSVVLFSSVLQYLEDPYAVLDAVMARKVPFILLDRTPFIAGAEDRLTVQTVSKRVYPASYPCRFLSRARLMAHLAGKYRAIETFQNADRANIPSEFLGMLLEREA